MLESHIQEQKEFLDRERQTTNDLKQQQNKRKSLQESNIGKTTPTHGVEQKFDAPKQQIITKNELELVIEEIRSNFLKAGLKLNVLDQVNKLF